MRVAIVGAGLSGMASAYFLQSTHEVTLFERSPRPGGHAATVTVEHAGATVQAELGFRYFFKRSYPYFLALLRILGVAPRWVKGSITIVDERGEALVLPPRSLRQLIALVRSPRRIRWLVGLERLRREAGAIVAAGDWSQSLADLLATRRYPAGFGPGLLYPFVAASWGAPLADTPQLPAYDVCKVMLHPGADMGFHDFAGGSAVYVEALTRTLAATRREFGVGVDRLARAGAGWRVTDDRGGVHEFDAVVVATESFAAASLLADVPEAAGMCAVIAGFRHFDVDIVVHGDSSLMPPRRADWSEINQCHRDDQAWMTDWPGSAQHVPVFRTWLPAGHPEPREVFARRRFRHLLVGKENLERQRRLAALQGQDRLWVAGMYTTDVDNHESALLSAVAVARGLAPESPALRRLADEAARSPEPARA